ncbi:SDR family NAD(P)-dependent oxidoreductase [Dactylosporangium sp. CA-139114]|uniref:SDR family NAD(P)-dependent oxidoreductase n=1 Tax=Dactylosporangium sp. CA-139114 TaxID=3239931 RepID=UPI003D981C43
MGQMQLFSARELAAMRDRTKAKHWWPGKDEFRKEAQRRRDWGLVRRHAEKLRRIHEPAETNAPEQASSDSTENTVTPPIRSADKIRTHACTAPSDTVPRTQQSCATMRQCSTAATPRAAGPTRSNRWSPCSDFSQEPVRRVTLTTGAARGIGEHTAREAAARVALVGLGPHRLETLAGQLGGVWFAADVTDQASVAAAVDGVMGAYGRIDAVVAKAGVASRGTVATGDIEALVHTVEVNLAGVMRTTAARPPHHITPARPPRARHTTSRPHDHHAPATPHHARTTTTRPPHHITPARPPRARHTPTAAWLIAASVTSFTASTSATRCGWTWPTTAPPTQAWSTPISSATPRTACPRSRTRCAGAAPAALVERRAPQHTAGHGHRNPARPMEPPIPPGPQPS